MNERESVFHVLNSIPKGRLCSYGDVAKQAGLPGRARWVGRILSQLPPGSSLPWFRVVNAAGKISFMVGSENYQRQLQLLISEGSAEPNGKLRWRECRWPD